MNIDVPEALAGEPLDRIVALETGVSRHEAQTCIDGGGVTVNGRVVKKGSVRIATADLITVAMAAQVAASLTPDPTIAFDVVYEDAHVIVIDKPAGLVVHPGAGNADGTLANGLLARYPELAGVGESDRPGIVHRLDGGTSGLMVVARTEVSREALVEALSLRAVTRQYRALSWGEVDGLDGIIDAPLGRSTRERTKMAVVADGRDARTRYEVVDRFTMPVKLTLLECTLETGRTHQIRVHLAAIGHPVVGDTRYGRARPALRCGRPFLHAERLAFDHPVTRAPLEFDSALPPDLSAVLAKLS